MDKLRKIPLEKLHPFPGNPFGVREDAEMQALTKSIREVGLLYPILARPLEGGDYEVVSGHRRRAACMKAGIDTVPVLVREMDRDAAVIALVDGNLHREHLLPSEKAKAYQMRLEALRHQGKRTSTHDVSKLRSDEQIGLANNESRETVRRYIRLNSLEKPLIEMVDSGRVALTPAVQLSYLPPEKQKIVADAIEETASTPSLSQAMRLKEMEKDGRLTSEAIFGVMEEEKGNQKEVLRIQKDRLNRYFPRGITDRQMEMMILKILDDYFRKRQRQRNTERSMER
ncbi:MAG: ParB/RepB/Spo0J family partition protein [Muribaculaceae bacterium]|nr:ParB/RepB/Spo0J family partition protein [Muribaculaceae bacterium]